MEQANIMHICSLVFPFDKEAKQKSALKNTVARLTFNNAFEGIKYKRDGYKKCNYFFCWPVEKSQELIQPLAESAFNSIQRKISIFIHLHENIPILVRLHLRKQNPVNL